MGAAGRTTGMSMLAACMTLWASAPAAAQDPGTGGASPGGPAPSAMPPAPAGAGQQGTHVDAPVLAPPVAFGARRPPPLRPAAQGGRAPTRPGGPLPPPP